MRPPQQKKGISHDQKRNHFKNRERIFVSASVPMAYRKQKRKRNATGTYYENNTLSKEADSKKTERAETTTSKRLLI